MHNPKLKLRLGRINIPTLVLWGAGDGIVRPSYGRAYAEAIPKARFKLIEKAGHLPHIEQPAVFMREVRRFLAA
jgi:pimeloyl-ACP methyl ester carboxylesterase